MPGTIKKNDKIPVVKVGIFMPCYNMGDYFNESLNSLRDQTYQNFIIIIADDASSQKTTHDKLAAIDMPRCNIYYEKKNMGLVRISNKYIDKLESEYVLLFSPDDKLHPDFLREQVEYLDTHPDTHAVCAWIQEFGEGDNLIKYKDELCKLPYMLVENHYSGAALMRKSAWLEAGKYDVNKNFYPNLDYDLWLSMLDKGFKLGTIPKPLFFWRVVSNSLSHRMKSRQMLVFRRELLKKYSALYEKHSSFVANHYLGVISKFEEYYELNEVGHEWLDNQYHALTKQNTDLVKENTSLSARLASSIQRPYIRSVLGKIKRRLQH